MGCFLTGHAGGSDGCAEEDGTIFRVLWGEMACLSVKALAVRIVTQSLIDS